MLHMEFNSSYLIGMLNQEQPSKQKAVNSPEKSFTLQVEIRDGHLMGTLGRQQPSKQKAHACSRLLSGMGPATFFGGGSILNGEGELQVLLNHVSVFELKPLGGNPEATSQT